MNIMIVLLCFVIFQNGLVFSQNYEPNWDSLDSRPIPEWYDDAKIGIFLHWGVFSVPSLRSEWFWSQWESRDQEIVDYMSENYPPNFSYQDFATDFTAELFDPNKWAELFNKSGARYVVLTSKHHEGFTLWPSKYSYSWNAKDIGPHRDLLGDLGQAVKKQGLEFGVYHSLYEWFNPMYRSDKGNNFTTQEFVNNKILPEMKELINTYHPSVLWSDGDWEAKDSYWRSTEFLAWLYNDSPVTDRIVVNDRWGIDIPCKHGDFYSCADRYNPGTLQHHKWENAMTIDKESWGFRRNAKLSDYFTTHELLEVLASTVSCGGNLLMNVGPTKDGIIAPIFEERLLDMGKWLEINREAIYGSKPWTYQNDTTQPGVWYTQKGSSVYAIVLQWPTDNVLEVSSPVELFTSNATPVYMLGSDGGKLKWAIEEATVSIKFPDKATVQGEHAWVLKIVT